MALFKFTGDLSDDYDVDIIATFLEEATKRGLILTHWKTKGPSASNPEFTLMGTRQAIVDWYHACYDPNLDFAYIDIDSDDDAIWAAIQHHIM